MASDGPSCRTSIPLGGQESKTGVQLSARFVIQLGRSSMEAMVSTNKNINAGAGGEMNAETCSSI